MSSSPTIHLVHGGKTLSARVVRYIHLLQGVDQLLRDFQPVSGQIHLLAEGRVISKQSDWDDFLAHSLSSSSVTVKVEIDSPEQARKFSPRDDDADSLDCDYVDLEEEFAIKRCVAPVVESEIVEAGEPVQQDGANEQLFRAVGRFLDQNSELSQAFRQAIAPLLLQHSSLVHDEVLGKYTKQLQTEHATQAKLKGALRAAVIGKTWLHRVRNKIASVRALEEQEARNQSLVAALYEVPRAEIQGPDFVLLPMGRDFFVVSVRNSGKGAFPKDTVLSSRSLFLHEVPIKPLNPGEIQRVKVNLQLPFSPNTHHGIGTLRISSDIRAFAENNFRVEVMKENARVRDAMTEELDIFSVITRGLQDGDMELARRLAREEALRVEMEKKDAELARALSNEGSVKLQQPRGRRH